MGITNDLHRASEYAMEEMVDELVSRGYREAEAYLLLSLIGDLRITGIVDEPNFVVSMVVPLNLLRRE
jgi:acetamidase/formamidase